MNSHELQLVDRIAPPIFIVGFNPREYKDSGLNQNCQKRNVQFIPQSLRPVSMEKYENCW
jgi:hypothetical protein